MRSYYTITPADAHANSLAKAILYHVLQRVSAQPNATASETYVDDLNQTSHNESRDLVIRQAVDSAIAIYEALQTENFVMSGKKRHYSYPCAHPANRPPTA